MPSPLDRIRNRPPATGDYTFAFDPNDAQKVADAEQAVRDAEMDVARQPASKTMKSALNKAKRALEKAVADTVTVTIVMQAIGMAALEELQHAHPRTPEQLERDESIPEEQRLTYDDTTFGPAALAASLVSLTFSDDPDSPVTTLAEDDATALWDTLAQFDRLQILGMVFVLNQRSARVDAAGKG